MEEGNQFNRDRASAYEFNEVAVENPDGGTALRLDSYSPKVGTGEIVSRKYTQLAKILPQTAINYLNEFVKKYSPGTLISNTVKTRLEGLSGKKLGGTMYLEVPPQTNPIPQAVLDAAKKRDIIIRDSNGTSHQ
jgi:filamentous hemagglutinin